MTESNRTEPLVDGVKVAVIHFGKAAFEVVSGIGALFVGVTKTVRSDDEDDDGASSAQTIEVE